MRFVEIFTRVRDLAGGQGTTTVMTVFGTNTLDNSDRGTGHMENEFLVPPVDS